GKRRQPSRWLCLSAKREFRPPDQSSNAGNREAAANRGRLLFGYFFLATQEKVTSCRATPDDVGVEFEGAAWAQKRAHPTDSKPAGFAHPSIRLRLLMKLLAIRLSPQAGKSLVIRTNGMV
ncbi:MAG: hypothetical protein WC825_05145, partial [Gallionellaceae bacterium]